MKKLLLALASVVAAVWALVPFPVRRRLVFGMVVLETRIGSPAASLRHLFDMADDLELAINERAMAYGKGEHPKHRLTNYHELFVTNAPPGSRIADLGCGYGAVAAEIAERVPGCTVIGIDSDPRNIAQAAAHHRRTNLEFRLGDVREDLHLGQIDIVVLSNILEHIDDRQAFLASVVERLRPKIILVRVPLFERDWKIALRREIGSNYFSDPSHFIEHTLGEFYDEMAAAGLAVSSCRTIWGEIWAVCRTRAAP